MNNSSDILVKSLDVESCKQVMPLIMDLFESDKLNFDESLSILEKSIRSDTVEGFYCVLGDEVVGYAAISMRLDIQSKGKIAELTEFVVAEDSRRQGIGSKLFEYVEQASKKLGCVELRFVSNFKREAAHRFYLNRGYTKSSYLFWKTL